MAHKIEIPIEFIFGIPQCDWIIGKARPTAWWNNCAPARLDLEVVSPKRFHGVRGEFPSSDLNDELLSRLPLGKLHQPIGTEQYEVALARINPRVGWNALPQEMRQMELDVILCEETNGGPPKSKFDPWAVRKEFLKLNGSFGALSKFLNRRGSWKPQVAPTVGSARSTSVSVYLPSCFWKDQAFIRNGLLSGPKAWLSSKRSYLHLTPRSEFPHLSYTSSTCFDAIRATVTIDFWRKAKLRLCAREDCNQIFERDSKHKKIYCDQYCGHIVSVRRGRAKTRKTVGRRDKAANRRGRTDLEAVALQPK